MSASLYQVRGLAHHYGDLSALDIPQLDLPRGAVIGLAGPNGSGKSTLLRILAFLEAPSQGSVLFEGTPRTPNTPGARQGITLLLQEPYLLRRSVRANLAYGLQLRGQGAMQTADLEEALQWVGLEPAVFRRRRWFALSGGEVKRVALAARLVLRPQVLLLDEPIAGVDAKSAELLRLAALRAREQWGATLVVASHDLVWLRRTVDRVWGLEDGRLTDGPPAREIALQNFRLLKPRNLGPGQSAVLCRVSGLLWEPDGGQGRVQLLADGNAYGLRLPLEELASLDLQLGQEAWLVFDEPC
ncbi:ATP-binding cassette domain-containing protein [Desulfarculales bacterium]